MTDRSDADILAMIRRAYDEAKADHAMQSDHDGWAGVMWFYMDWILANLADRDTLIREHRADTQALKDGLREAQEDRNAAMDLRRPAIGALRALLAEFEAWIPGNITNSAKERAISVLDDFDRLERGSK